MLSVSRRTILAGIGVLILGTMLLVLIQSLLLSYSRPAIMLGVEGRSAQLALSGFYEPEHDAGTAFRWSDGAGRIRFDLPYAAQVALTLQIGAAPPGLDPATLSIQCNNQVLARTSLTSQSRRLHMLLPMGQWQNPRVDLGLDSATVVLPPDTRAIGVRFSQISLRPLGVMLMPDSMLIAVQMALVCLLTLTLWRLAIPGWLCVALALLTAIGLCMLTVWQPELSYSYSLRLLLAMLLLCMLSWLILPQLEEQLHVPLTLTHALWGITILATLIRLIGALYPLYSAHDLSLNVERFERTIAGTLISSNRSFEFRSGVTIYPPGPYLALQPAMLLGIPAGLIVQAGNACIDGLGALAVGVLALRLGANQRVALLASLLYAALPVMLTSLYWGHSAQIFGQAMMVPLALALLACFDRSFSFYMVGILLAIALLSHIGVTILALAWLGVMWLLLSLRQKVSVFVWRRLTIALLMAGLIGLVFVYGPALAFKLDQTAQVGERISTEAYVSMPLIWRAFQISFYSWGLPLVLLGLIRASQVLALPRGAAELLLSWLLVSAVFCVVELLTGLQVRYFVFLAPLACLGIALSLDWLALRGRIGAILAWAIAILLVVQGATSWYNAVFNDVQMSMVPLLR